MRLFVERAATARPGFRLAGDAEAAAVAQICCRLDGIPLAIELAAARIRVLTAAQIAARLDDRFHLLTRGERGALPRHQTLRALIDWSYDSLPAAEATLLRRLSVFAGGWTLEAAEAVCSGVQVFRCSGVQAPTGARDALADPVDPSDPPDPSDLHAPDHRFAAVPPQRVNVDDVLDLLDALVDRSLVLVDEVARELRYRMLETVREYVREKLEGSGEGAAMRDRHRDWCVQRAEQSEVEFENPGRGTAWGVRMDAEIDNFRAALRWCQEEADTCPGPAAAAAGFRIAHALYWFCVDRGHASEGLQWLEGALARSGSLSPELRGSALYRAALLTYTRGERDRSRHLLKAARREYEAVLATARQEGDPRSIARALLKLAEVAAQDGDTDAAWRLCTEAGPLFATLGDRDGQVGTLTWLAGICMERGDREAARPLLEERLAICRECGDAARLIHALGGLGHLERDAGNYAGARALYQESLLLRRTLGDQIPLAQSLEDLAVLAGRERQAKRASRLLGAAQAFCERLGAHPPVAVVEEYERTVTQGRAALGETAFAAAWAEGRAMSLDQAIDDALGEA